jgi:hypothetical protein
LNLSINATRAARRRAVPIRSLPGLDMTDERPAPIKPNSDKFNWLTGIFSDSLPHLIAQLLPITDEIAGPIITPAGAGSSF